MELQLVCSFLTLALFASSHGQDYSMTVSCDDNARVFFDGDEQFAAAGDTSLLEWNRATNFDVPCNTRVIAIECLNVGGPTGILADFDNGMMTDDSWKCTNTYEAGWTQPGFDAHPWPAAEEYGAYGTIPYTPGPITYGTVVGMTGMPEFIWTDQPGPGGDMTVYCRKVVPAASLEATVSCDDIMEIYFDGVEADDPTGDLGRWYQASDLCFPWSTHVIAVKCHNGGGPAGILGTFANGAITTDSSWKCTNTYEDGWTERGFNDNGWPAAVEHGAYGSIAPVPGPITYGPVAGMIGTPEFIWTDDPGHYGDRDVYCRKTIAGTAASYSMVTTCDDQQKVYFDGDLQFAQDIWYTAVQIDVPWNTLVIATECNNVNGPCGVLAEFSNGLITDASWKCSDTYEAGWTLPTFDDSAWPAATDYGAYGSIPAGDINYGAIAGITGQPHWIWTDEPGPSGDRRVYCRINLGCPCTSGMSGYGTSSSTGTTSGTSGTPAPPETC